MTVIIYAGINSLFLPSSDGKLTLNMDEAMELLGVLFSVLQKGPQIHSDMGHLCEARKVKGEFLIEAGCLQRTFAYNIKLTWAMVPALSAAMERLTLEERTALFTKMDGFLRKGRVGAPFKETDTNGLLLIGYYMELLFYRFDRNRDGVFDQDEAKAAFPLFRGFIEKKANELGRKDPKEHYKIYTYILAKQKIPASFWEKLDYLNWQAENPYTVDRIGVVNILTTMLAF